MAKLSTAIVNKLELLGKRRAELEQLMADVAVISDHRRAKQIGQEYRKITEVGNLYAEYQSIEAQVASAEAIASGETDAELKEMAQQELTELAKKGEKVVSDIQMALLPEDEMGDSDAIIEIRAGTGGDEAGIFAADLFRMYARYAERVKWSLTEMSSVDNEIGSVKEVIFQISGEQAYAKLAMESGVHRVQRVPVTESQGRIHTSTATVAVLPVVEDVELEIEERDIKMDIFHASGHGGQNVNKVATAVRLTHLPTDLVVACQNERSQLQNRRQAMEILKARLWKLQQDQAEKERTDARRAQIGSGERSEKIRTYNFPQSRITDHRIGFTTHSLREVLDGDLNEIIVALMTAKRAALLAAAAGE